MSRVTANKQDGLWPNKKISVLGNRAEKKLGRIGAHFFLEKNIILCILKGIMHKIIYFFSENLKKILGLTTKLR